MVAFCLRGWVNYSYHIWTGVKRMNTREAVVDRLLFLCEQKNITPNALARISAVPPSTLKNILNGGSQNPGIVTLKMLCDGLEISIPEFFETPIFRNLEQEIK